MICLYCRYYDQYRECCLADLDAIEAGSAPCIREDCEDGEDGEDGEDDSDARAIF